MLFDNKEELKPTIESPQQEKENPVPEAAPKEDDIWSYSDDQVDRVKSQSYDYDAKVKLRNGETETRHFSGTREYNVKQPTINDSYNSVRIDPKTGNDVFSPKASAGDTVNVNPSKKFTPTKKETTVGRDAPSGGLAALGEENQGSVYKKMKGTIEQPNVTTELIPSLFINNTTTPGDVHQRDIGDCYFLAALLSIVHADPNFIPNIMKLSSDGKRVRTMLYHKEGEKWVQKPIETEYGMMGDGYENKGSYYRIAFDPKQSEWSADIDKGILSVNRKEMYEAALWVNCMEQAFIAYADLYGQYGQNGTEKANNRDGDSVIDNGGFAGHCLHMFFGDEVENSNVEQLYDIPIEVGVMDAMQPLVYELMKFSMTQTHDMKEETYMCVASHKSHLITRGHSLSRMLLNELEAEAEEMSEGMDAAALNQAMQDVKDIDILIEAFGGTTSAAARELVKSDSEAGICNALHEKQMSLAQNSAIQMLYGQEYEDENGEKKNRKVGTYVNLRAYLGTVIEKSHTDITMIRMHAYNVSRVDFKDKEGKPYVVDTSTTYDDFKRNVDLDNSSVEIENPHGKTKAVRPGETEERYDEGNYTLSLREALSSITQFTSVLAENHKTDGKENVQSVRNAAFLQNSQLGTGVADKGKYTSYYSNGPIHDEVNNGDYTHMDNHEAFFKDNPIENAQSKTKKDTEGKYIVKPSILTSRIPSPNELYEKNDSGVEISYINGSIKSPNRAKDIVPNSLFIDDTPKPEDIIQGSIADNQFLAAVQQVIRMQPGRIHDLFTVEGDTIDVAFFHKEGNRWTPTHIRSQWGYVQNKVDADKSGAKLRLSDKPSEKSLWKATIENQGSTYIKITKKEIYEAALWVNMLENAYTIFAQNYGPYGDASSQEKTQESDRYAAITDINSNKCLNVFFGSHYMGLNSMKVSNSKDKNMLKGKDAIIHELSKINQPKKEEDRNVHTLVSASISNTSAFDRAKSQSKSLLKEAKNNLSPEALDSLNAVINTLNSSGKQLTETNSSASIQLGEDLEQLLQFESDLAKLSHWNKFKASVGSLASLKNNNQFASANKVYNVTKVEFFDNEGKAITNTSNLQELMNSVNIQQSMIHLQTAATDNNSISVTMSLEEYLWNVDEMAFGTLTNFHS